MPQSIRTRQQLATLLERQMTAASTRQAAGDEIDARTALKTYLLEAHGALRSRPDETMEGVATAAGLSLARTDDPALLELTQGDLSFWLETTGGRFLRLYTTASARDADRVHDALIECSRLLEPVWILPSQLEGLAARVGGRAVLFSLHHDRRALRRDTADDPEGVPAGTVDFVTLRFWAPTAMETLGRLRRSDVMPGATSVHSVRVRSGTPDAYAVVEAFHGGKLTSVGSAYAQHERVVRAVLDAYTETADAVDAAADVGRAIRVPVRFAPGALAQAVARMFTGGDPFRLWGLPRQVAEEGFVVHAVDVGTGYGARIDLSLDGAQITPASGTPASVALRFLANLQFHVDADVRSNDLPAESGFAIPPARGARKPVTAPFDERDETDVVARWVLAECIAQWLRGATAVTLTGLLAGTHASPARLDLARRVMNEAAAYEWREALKPVLAADGTTQWRWHDGPAPDPTARTRELVRLQRQGLRLVKRVSGGVEAPWLQLSLFEAGELVPPASADD